MLAPGDSANALLSRATVRAMTVPQNGEAHPTPAVGALRRLSAGAVASLIGIVLLLIFMLQNTADVRVHFLVWHFKLSLWLLSLISAVVGAAVWFGFGVIRRHRHRHHHD